MTHKQKMDIIVQAFEDFIRKQDYFDILYSEKIGYLRLLVESPESDVVRLRRPQDMMDYLCSDLICEVVYSPDNPKESDEDVGLTEYEREEISRQFHTIFEKMGMEKYKRMSEIEYRIDRYLEEDEKIRRS